MYKTHKLYFLMHLYKVLPGILLCLAAASCVKDEPLNAECDIVSATLPDEMLNRQPLIYNDRVVLIVKNDVSVMALAPEFELTPGATIEPPSGTTRNFIVPQNYVVTSQDGQWHKTYSVEVQRNNSINLNYSFENVRQVSALGGTCSYDVFFEAGLNGEEKWAWATANPAFALTLQASGPNTFPTYQGDNGVNGKCAVLVTRSTGDFGGRVGKPLAAGSLFIGKFDMTNAIKYPLQATQFGTPFNRIPTSFSGYYKYKPGDTYCMPDDKGTLQPVPGQTDMFNLYAVLYETDDGHEWLDGTNVLAADNPYIISTAEIPDRHESDEWVDFFVPFVNRPGKAIDPDKLKAGRYNIAVVMSSSEDGDYFRGAIGSTLMVDELSITCQSNSDN